MRDELRKSLAFLPRRSEPWIWISKPSESRIKKFICGRSLPTAALSIVGPAKNELRRTKWEVSNKTGFFSPFAYQSA